MKIDCEHWSDCGVGGGGCCALGKFGGKPSIATCRIFCKGEDSQVVMVEVIRELGENPDVIFNPPKPVNCVHRKKIGTEEKKCCGGKTTVVPIYACELKKNLSQCRNCSDLMEVQ